MQGGYHTTSLGLVFYAGISKRTFLPFRASPAASEILVEVFPVPPFWLAIEITIGKLNLPKTQRVDFDSVSYNCN
jgi:hypothetical protein